MVDNGQNIKFIIENNINVSFDIYSNLIDLYLPLVGAVGISIYMFLFTKSSINNKLNNSLYYDQKEIANQFLKISNEQFNININLLEAVGLVSSFVKKNQQNEKIFVLNAPLCMESFNKNVFLKNHFISNTSKLEYENLLHTKISQKIDKFDYYENTFTYKEIFSDHYENTLVLLSNNNEQTTQEIVVNYYPNHEDNIKNLSSSQFIKYLFKRNVNSYESNLISFGLNNSLDDSRINLFIDFNFQIQQKINVNYLKKIIADFLNRGIFSFDDIKRNLTTILETKKQKNILLSSNNLENQNHVDSKTNNDENINNLEDNIKTDENNSDVSSLFSLDFLKEIN